MRKPLLRPKKGKGAREQASVCKTLGLVYASPYASAYASSYDSVPPKNAAAAPEQAYYKSTYVNSPTRASESFGEIGLRSPS